MCVVVRLVGVWGCYGSGCGVIRAVEVWGCNSSEGGDSSERR